MAYTSKEKERVLELHRLISMHSHNYHSLDAPTIEDHEYELTIQKSGTYYDLVGNTINKNMIEMILDTEIDGDYKINIIDKDMKSFSVLNKEILLGKTEYTII